jgi:DNA-binding NarL/FixJ family response regulator
MSIRIVVADDPAVVREGSTRSSVSTWGVLSKLGAQSRTRAALHLVRIGLVSNSEVALT